MQPARVFYDEETLHSLAVLGVCRKTPVDLLDEIASWVIPRVECDECKKAAGRIVRSAVPMAHGNGVSWNVCLKHSSDDICTPPVHIGCDAVGISGDEVNTLPKFRRFVEKLQDGPTPIHAVSGDKVTKQQMQSLKALPIFGAKFHDLKDDAFRELCTFPSLKELHLPFCSIKPAALANISKLSGLKALSLHSDSIDKVVPHIATLHELTELDLGHGKDLTDASIKLLARMTQLTELDLDGTTRAVKDPAMEELCGKLTSLRVLNVAGAQAITTHSLKAICELPKLTTLNLSSTNFADSDFCSLKKATRLTNVDLGTTNAKTHTLETLGTLVNLRALDLSCCMDVPTTAFKHLSALTNLERLCLMQCPVGDRGMSALKPLGKNLKDLDLTFTGVSDAGLAVVSTFSKLESLNLHGCSEMTNTGVKKVCEGCRSLEELQLGLGLRLTDAVGKYIADNLSELRYLNLYKCLGTTRRVLNQVTRLEKLYRVGFD